MEFETTTVKIAANLFNLPPGKKITVDFKPAIAGSNGQMTFPFTKPVQLDNDGKGQIDLPAPAHYKCVLRGDNFDKPSFKFNLLPSATPISLDVLFNAGSPSLPLPAYQVMDDKIAAALGDDYASNYFEFASNALQDEEINVNGVRRVFGDHIPLGATLAASLTNAVELLNSNPKSDVQRAAYSTDGISKLIARAKRAGGAGNQITLSRDKNSTVVSFPGTNPSDVNLQGGFIGISNLTLGNHASQIVSFTANPQEDDALQFDGLSIECKSNPSSDDQIQIGATLKDTVDNIVAWIADYSDTNSYFTSITTTRLNDNTLVFVEKRRGAVYNRPFLTGLTGSGFGDVEQGSLVGGTDALDARLVMLAYVETAVNDLQQQLNATASTATTALSLAMAASRTWMSISASQNISVLNNDLFVAATHLTTVTTASIANNNNFGVGRILTFSSENNARLRIQAASVSLSDGATLHTSGNTNNNYVEAQCAGRGSLTVAKITATRYVILEKTGAWTFVTQ